MPSVPSTFAISCGSATTAVVPIGSTLHPLVTEGELPQIEGDPADEDTLRDAGIMRAAGLVSAMESDRENVLVTLTARQTNPIMRIVSMLTRMVNKLGGSGTGTGTGDEA